jgi:alkylation response protein AidB-like acyl-CoA dehydrogenase
MALLLTEEHQQLQDVVRQFLTERVSVTAHLETEEDFEPSAWAQLAGELGLVGLAVPEAYGGSGYGLLELGLVLEETGRALLSAPLLSSVLAGEALLLADDEAACQAHLPGICSGEVIGSVAWMPSSSGALPVAEQQEGTWTISGTAGFVLAGHLPGVLVVFAETGAGLGAFVVEAQAPGVERRPLKPLDLTRRLAELTFVSTPVTPLGKPGGAPELLEALLQRLQVLLCCELVGAADRCLEMAVSYAKTREQFGRPIGSFQAVKHTCADMYVRVEAARAASRQALTSLDAGSADSALAALVAAAYVPEACVAVATDNIQVHGGIGFTWEHQAHLYYRRTKSGVLLFQRPRDAREALVTKLGAA